MKYEKLQQFSLELSQFMKCSFHYLQLVPANYSQEKEYKIIAHYKS